MLIKDYIVNFERLGFGMFVHFGLYSVMGQGEWYKYMHNVESADYNRLISRFKVKESWAKDLVKIAKQAGCKYITLTTRHHDGFSLYNTCGLNDFDAPHSACKRDLIKEFVEECKKGNIVPFFYHTLLDWYDKNYNDNFKSYTDYLILSVELLCKNYGQIGGFWFDGYWDKPEADWQFDRLYATIRKYQPSAMIINNTGLNALGQVSHKDIDCVTFERGKPIEINMSEKYIAGEMCQVLNDHWGYAENDCNYKSVKKLISDLTECRRYNCNFLLNLGLLPNGGVKKIDEGIFLEIGKWIKANKNFIYNAKPSDIVVENAFVLKDDKCYYAVISCIGVGGDENVSLKDKTTEVRFLTDKKIKDLKWLDNARAIELKNNSFIISPFDYGTSLGIRVATFKI